MSGLIQRDFESEAFLATAQMRSLLQEARASARTIAAEVMRLHAVVERLASSDAFTSAHFIDGRSGEELIARIDYARAALATPSTAPAEASSASA
jgi:hypothetical protein